MLKKSFIIGILFLLPTCGVMVSKVIPFHDLPKPLGRYTIGTMIETWVDNDREEWFTEDDLDDVRRIVVQFWYPIDDGIGKYSPYMDQWKRRLGPISEQVEVNKALIHSIKDVKTNSYLNATMKKMDDKMPLIIFSHGLGGMRMQNTIQMEALASEGYFVLAIDHSYDANITLFEDGSSADFRSASEGELTVQEFWDLRIPQINTRSDDVIFVLNQIESFIDSGDGFWNSIDMDRIGMMGHSFGGATAIITATRDDRLDACMALDGWIVPIESSYIQNGMKVPLLYIGRPK
jgi:dienelactone hydrolase